jgi:hypothetical protein
MRFPPSWLAPNTPNGELPVRRTKGASNNQDAMTGAGSQGVVIGGIGTIEGPIVGTRSSSSCCASCLAIIAPTVVSQYLVALGAVAIAVMLFAPRGICGVIEARFDLRFFPVERWAVAERSDTGR